MSILIKNATIIDKNSNFNGLKKDILVKEGKIIQIENEIVAEGVQLIHSTNLHVSPSWADIRADFCEPGNEQRENLHSGSLVAMAGGFVYVSLVSSTNPTVFQSTTLEFIQNKVKNLPVQLLPYACITKESKGEQLAEMYDVYTSGARLFSDDLQSLSSGIVYRALLYSKIFNGKLVLFCRNPFLSKSCQVNEGLASLKTGLKGEPTIAESIDLDRYLSLLEYTDAQLHISGISCASSLNKIIEAKKKGLKVTVDVHIDNLLFNEEKVFDFNQNYKVLPVLRREEDRLALIEGVNNNWIDGIASNHRPFTKEDTEVEFDDAPFGNIHLQTFFPELLSLFPLEKCIEILSFQNRLICSVPPSTIQIGNIADLTCFDPSLKWIFNEESNLSKSINSPFFNNELTGKALATVHQHKNSVNLDHLPHIL
ncbi:MAG: dihydroorotase [Flavobacteriia bacterium]|nr:dihydroorotase [Flavobacteriia bacterium]